jgi:hypothetical protein
LRQYRSLAANRGGKGAAFFDRLAKGSDYLATGTRIADCSADISPIAHSRQTGVVQAAGQPPPSAIKQCGGIGETIGFRLHADHGGGQVGLLRIEDGELIDLTGVQLLLNDVEARLGGDR